MPATKVTLDVNGEARELVLDDRRAQAAPRVDGALRVTTGFKPPVVPAAFFGIVLGLAGLGNAWRAAHEVWQAPAAVGEALMAIAAIIWAVVLVLFILKWIFAREQALDEAQHPVQCCFIGLAGVATMLIALAAIPYSRLVAQILFGAGAAFTLAFALWRTGLLWRGGRDHGATTPVLYLPTVAGCFVLRGAVFAEERPARLAALAFLRRDVDDAVRRFGAVERGGRGSLEDVDVLNLVGVDVIETRRASGAARRRIGVHFDAVDIHDRRVTERERRLAANADA